jgi:CHASE3 domain sensor protein
MVEPLKMKTKSLLNRTAQLAFGAAILTLLVVGAISYRGMVLSSESDQWVRHTHEVLENLGELHLAMETVEANCRGYVLTGADSYLQSCLGSRLSVEQYEAAVSNLTVDNPVQQNRVPELERLTSEKFALADRSYPCAVPRGCRRRWTPFETARPNKSWLGF